MSLVLLLCLICGHHTAFAAKYFVTGCTGVVGFPVVEQLALSGDDVTCLVRDVRAAKELLPSAVEVVEGDVTRADSYARALKGTDIVIHAAGKPESYASDERLFWKVNTNGTREILEASLRNGVSRVVYVSTMDVFEGDTKTCLVETNPRSPGDGVTTYEESKIAAQAEANKAHAAGLDVISICPCAVYGPTAVVNGFNGALLELFNNEMPLSLHGGMPLVHNRPLARAILTAALLGNEHSGTSILVCDTKVSLSFDDVASEARAIRPSVRGPFFAMPTGVARFVAAVAEAGARLTGLDPLVTRGIVEFMQWQPCIDTAKAGNVLHYESWTVKEGLQDLLNFFEAKGLVSQPSAPTEEL